MPKNRHRSKGEIKMTPTRKSLRAIGLNDEQIESVIEMHTETINALKDKLDAAESNKEASDKLKADYEKLKAEYDEIKKSAADNAKYKEQYESTKAEYDKFKTDTETKAAKAAVDASFTKWLINKGYPEKVAVKIVKSGEFNPELDKDGSIKNEDKLSEKVDTEWLDFKPQKHIEGARTETPPANVNKSAFDGLTLSEKMKYANEHPNDANVKAFLGN
jgi:hypothetical protein